MTEQPTCPRPECGRVIHDQAYVCIPCRDQEREQLELVARLAGEAATTIARLDRIAATAGGARESPPEPDLGRAESALYPTPLPVDLMAAADHAAGVNTLVTWARHCAEERGLELPAVRPGCPHWTCAKSRRAYFIGPACEPPEHPLAVAATWLAGQLDWLRHRPEADEAYDEISYACRLLIAVVDRPADRWYAGPCGVAGCTERLYPVAGARTTRCACGADHDLGQRKTELLERVEEQWATATRAAHLLTALGVRCTPSMVRNYADRGRLAPHPDLDAMGHPRYRLGSIRELMHERRELDLKRRADKAIREAERAVRKARKAAADTPTGQSLPVSG